jgi:hypothetical protein
LKKKVHKLNVEPRFDFILIGISSHEKDYFVSWAINKHFVFNLVKLEDLRPARTKGAAPCSFSFYRFDDEDKSVTWRLISNRGPNGFFAEEFSNIDYFLHARGDITVSAAEEMIPVLRQIKGVMTAFVINPETIKSGKQFLFD